MRSNQSRALASRATVNPYTRWLHTWLKCDEAPGSLVLADSSGNARHVSPNYAAVWRPNFTIGPASYLKCMRPATPFNSGVLLEPTAVGTSGIGITGATEPVGGWNLTPGATTVDNAGANQITWTARTPAIALTPGLSGGVTPGLGGAVCVSRNTSGFDNVTGFMKTDTWEYTANTLSCTTAAINDSFSAIPAGLVAGDVVLSTGWANLDNNGFAAVTSATASQIVLTGGLFAADSNAGAAPITLRRVYYPNSLAICAWVTGQAGTFTNVAHLFRAGGLFGGAGSGAAYRSYYRENASRTMVNQMLSPIVGDSTSAISGALTAGTPAHLCVIFDRLTGTKVVYLNGVFSVQQTMSVASKALMRDVLDATWFSRLFTLQFFAGDPKVAYRDVQLYVAPSLPAGMSGNLSFRDIISSIMAGNGPPLASEWS